MLDAAARARLLARHGAAAEAWLDALPTRLSALAERWWVALDLASPPLAGRTSVVVRGRLDGAPVMLKLAFDPEDAAVEAEALRAWGASGTPRLLASDPAAGALLLEAIVPGTALLADPAPPPVAACGALLRALRAPAPPAGLSSLRERVAWIFELWLARHAAEPAPARRGAGGRCWSAAAPPRTSLHPTPPQRLRSSTATSTPATCSTAARRAASSRSTRARAPATRSSTPSTSCCTASRARTPRASGRAASPPRRVTTPTASPPGARRSPRSTPPRSRPAPHRRRRRALAALLELAPA